MVSRGQWEWSGFVKAAIILQNEADAIAALEDDRNKNATLSEIKKEACYYFYLMVFMLIFFSFSFLIIIQRIEQHFTILFTLLKKISSSEARRYLVLLINYLIDGTYIHIYYY